MKLETLIVLFVVPQDCGVAPSDVKGVYRCRKRAEEAYRRWNKAQGYHVSIVEAPFYEKE